MATASRVWKPYGKIDRCYIWRRKVGNEYAYRLNVFVDPPSNSVFGNPDLEDLLKYYHRDIKDLVRKTYES